MNILPKYGLLQYRNAARIYSKPVTESLVLFQEETKFLKTSVFIAHKQGELEELDSAVNFLKSFGVLIYADYWLDQSNPEDITTINTSQSRQQIENKIKEHKKFIFLATENGITSKECKWAVRYAKTQKDLNDIAILPIREDYTDYGGAEYLQKYPYIQKREAEMDQYDVVFPNGDIIELGEWLGA
ncbi:hypothetical protein ABW636_08640 [Aquimarina sp. 2201CG1-2-11]|uniref:hypothetical protein n=1 Tax=Aquimarina discodermiae TaxID=3231043 RepID=UPI0034631E91